MFKFKEKRIDPYLNLSGETSKRSFVYAICLKAITSIVFLTSNHLDPFFWWMRELNS